MRPARFGVYVHFPYCLSKCHYCDFASVAEPRIPHRRYLAALLRELELRIEERGPLPAPVDSLYVGGGTPSLWDPECLARLIEALRAKLPFAPDAELTLEANPRAAEISSLSRLRQAGIDRLSFGVQSFHPRTLKALGRTHDGAEAVAAIERAKKAGFPRLSVDLIFGAPGQTPGQARADAEKAVALGVDHVSFYGLTLEGLAIEVPLAKLVRRGRVKVPDDVAQEKMGREVRAILEDAGLARYEISNFARPGQASRHNLLYWHGGEYLALGCGAHGFYAHGERAVRYGNDRNPARYLEAEEPTVEREHLTRQERFAERLFLGLRLVQGLDLQTAASETVGAIPASTEAAIGPLVRAGLLEREGARLWCTERGLDFHTELAAKLLPDAPRRLEVVA